MNRTKGWHGSLVGQAMGPAAKRTHGKCSTGTYRSWGAMIQRCTNPANKHYKNYGGRGIKVHESWLDFQTFLFDMGERPEGKSLDRYPNVNGNYEPGNCRWATTKEQALNKRTNRHITFMGRTEPLTIWAEIIKVPRETLTARIRRGWSLERAIGLELAKNV